MMLLSKNDIAGLRRVMAAALRRGASAHTICGLLDRAVSGLYSPRGGFSKRDLDISLLVKSIGGPHLLYALQHSQGFASWRTVAHHHKIPRLLPSIRIPTTDEINSNISSFLDPDSKPHPAPTANGSIPGNIIMVDGIALETRCRYCPKCDSILGLCHEHSHNVSTKVETFQSVENVHLALQSDDENTRVCFGSDATVLAIAPYAREDHYNPIPLAVSPSCKREKGVALAEWLQTALNTYANHEYGAVVNGDIWSIGSDGDSTFRFAKHKICMVKPIEEDSPLGHLLSPLLGLNLYRSKEGIIGTCDPKHIFKRFATLLRSILGIIIKDLNISPHDIVEQLAFLMPVEKAHQLLDPVDKQNVPKAVTLVQSLLQLKDLPENDNPRISNNRQAILFVAEMMGYFMQPFISVSMTLSEQVKSLATYSFLAAAVQIKHGSACLTGALYADSQATVKNLIITIARMQVMDPMLKLYILLEGTDRLEALFGDCRTQDHARNFDVEQLAGKLGVATLINAAMERNPDLDRGHRRLSLKGAMGIDHVNPKSWEGNVCVGNVNLSVEWLKGQETAQKLLQSFFGDDINFTQIFSASNCDLLRPLGVYIGISATDDDKRSEEENSTPLFLSEKETSTPSISRPASPSSEPLLRIWL